jgi:hypothetical protein
VRVQLREQKQGGVAAVVVLPKTLLTAAPTAAVPAAGGPVTGATHSFSLPGADAEVNSNVLSGRSQSGDPLVTLAEEAVREAAADEPTHHGKPESPAETTMELLAPVPPEPTADELVEAHKAHEAHKADEVHEAVEPHRPVAPHEPHEPRGLVEPDDESGAVGGANEEHTRADDEPLTDKGLPKRTPKITASAPAPRQRNSAVDADALRRRLGGFRRGAEAGHRDVAAEIEERTGETRLPDTHSTASEEFTGGTAEEASS